jgi:hypothetical protein
MADPAGRTRTDAEIRAGLTRLDSALDELERTGCRHSDGGSRGTD